MNSEANPVIDLDAIANDLGLQTRQLKQEIYELGLAEIVSEARRLAHAEAFGQGSVGLKITEQRHLTEAAKNLGVAHYEN